MASTRRRSNRDVIAELLGEGHRFGFFQAVRLLALCAGDSTDKPPVPGNLRFSTPMSLAFQASDIASITPRAPSAAEKSVHSTLTDESHPRLPAQSTDTSAPEIPFSTTDSLTRPLEMVVGFMGLTGPSGVLPVPYTELFIERHNQYHDSSGHAFLDLFTHRAVTLFYLAWRKHRFYLHYEAKNPDGFSRNILDIVGMGLSHLQRKLQTESGGIPDRFLIHYAGLLAQKPVPATNIAALIRGFFNVEARLDQFVGQWMTLPEGEQSALDGRPCRLGQNAFVGERLWDRQTKIRLQLGPMDRKQFSRFMPGQPGLDALRELTRLCVGLTLDCDVTLILNRSEVPEPVLSSRSEIAPQLGYSTWLHSRPALCDAKDVCFTLLGNKHQTQTNESSLR